MVMVLVITLSKKENLLCLANIEAMMLSISSFMAPAKAIGLNGTGTEGDQWETSEEI